MSRPCWLQLFAGLLLLAFLSLPAGAQGRLLRVGTDEWPPYEFEHEGRVTGLCTEILYEVLADMGEDVIPPVQYPWKRGLEMLGKGQLDILYSGIYDPDRLEFALYPAEPLVESRWAAFVRSEDVGRLDFNGLASFAGHKVGMVIGYSYTPEINAWAEGNPRVERVASDGKLLAMLRQGRIDYALCDSLNCRSLIKRLQLGGQYVELFAPPLREIRIFPLFSRAKLGEEFAARFDVALRQFKSTPRYQEILDSYQR